MRAASISTTGHMRPASRGLDTLELDTVKAIVDTSILKIFELISLLSYKHSTLENNLRYQIRGFRSCHNATIDLGMKRGIY